MNEIKGDNLYALCAAVGYISIHWTIAERQMDNCVHLIFARLGGVPGETKKPFSLRPKIAYLTKAFKRNPHLSPHKYRALDLLQDAKDCGEKRHLFIHGNLSGLEGSTLTIDKLRPGTDGYEVETTSFDLQTFPQLGEELADLGEGWANLAADLLHEEQSRKLGAPPPPPTRRH